MYLTVSKIFFITYVVLNCNICLGKVAPEYIKPCIGLKPDCLKKNVQETLPLFVKGIPSLGINSSDPLTYGTIKLNLPGDLKLEFREGVLTGLRKCVVDSVVFGRDDAAVDLHCNITIKGKYRASGKVLVVAINGDGDAKLKVSNLELKAKLKFVDTVRDGVTYYDVKDYKVDHEIKNNVHFDLTNLFKGSPELSQTVLTFFNENWKELVAEFGDPIIEVIVNIAFKNVKEFFSKVPKDELIVF